MIYGRDDRTRPTVDTLQTSRPRSEDFGGWDGCCLRRSVPAMRQQLVDPLRRVRVNPHEDVGKVFLRIHVVRDAAHDEREQDRHVLSSGLMADKQRILPDQGRNSQRILGAVVIERHPRVSEKGHQGPKVLPDVPERLTDRAPGRMELCVMLFQCLISR